MILKISLVDKTTIVEENENMGQVVKGIKYEILRLVMQEKKQSKRNVGRRRCSWLQNVRECSQFTKIGTISEYSFKNTHKRTDGCQTPKWRRDEKKRIEREQLKSCADLETP